MNEENVLEQKPQTTRTRVSQLAPGFTSRSHRAWQDAISDPDTRAALDRGLADVDAGRVSPWSKVLRRVRLK